MRLLIEALSRMTSWLRREEGQTLVEYGLIVGLVSVAAIAVMVTMGGAIGSLFGDIAACFGVGTGTCPA